MDLGSHLCKQNTVTVAARLHHCPKRGGELSSLNHLGLSELNQFSQFTSVEALMVLGLEPCLLCLRVLPSSILFFIHLGRNVLLLTFLPVFPYCICPDSQRINPLLIQCSPERSFSLST